jgi:hypothetical protein
MRIHVIVITCRIYYIFVAIIQAWLNILLSRPPLPPTLRIQIVNSLWWDPYPTTRKLITPTWYVLATQVVYSSTRHSAQDFQSVYILQTDSRKLTNKSVLWLGIQRPLCLFCCCHYYCWRCYCCLTF